MLRGVLIVVVFAMATAAPALAGPPFLTDDPVPTDYQHYEEYAFTTLDKNAGSRPRRTHRQSNSITGRFATFRSA
jgi:hypothetical protein